MTATVDRPFVQADDGRFGWQTPGNLQNHSKTSDAVTVADWSGFPARQNVARQDTDHEAAGPMTPLTARPIPTASPFAGISAIQTVAHQIVSPTPASSQSFERHDVPPARSEPVVKTADVQRSTETQPVPSQPSLPPAAPVAPRKTAPTVEARLLFRSLRGESPVSPEEEQRTAAEWAAASEEGGKLQINDINLTHGTQNPPRPNTRRSLQPVPDPAISGQAVVTKSPQSVADPQSVPVAAPEIPETVAESPLLPSPVPPAPYASNQMPQPYNPNWISEGCNEPENHSDRKASRRSVAANRKARRQQRASRMGGRFVEFYDPELDCLCPDDYNMPVLLVAASNEEDPQNESDYDATYDASDGDRLLNRRLTDIRPTLDYAWGDKDKSVLPEDFHARMDNGEYVDTVAPRMVLQWAPTNLWYHPLYFEDPGLERYGHTRRPLIQPFVSTGRFLGQVAGLPYQMTLHPPHCPEYALGYYQPGECAPKLKYQIPFNEEATAVEALWITGLILLIP